jgi:hypothetical protein
MPSEISFAEIVRLLMHGDKLFVDSQDPQVLS